MSWCALELDSSAVKVLAQRGRGHRPQLHELQERLAALVDDYRSDGIGDDTARRVLIYRYARPVDSTPHADDDEH